MHLEEAEMGRIDHMFFALGIAVELMNVVMALTIHAFAPRFFTTYASDKILELAKILEEMHDE